MKRFENRREAGRKLAEELKEYQNMDNVMVLGLPRGGIPVAYEIAKRLGAPLDVLIVRKLGLPYNKEVAFGAIASGGIKTINQQMVNRADISENDIEEVIQKEKHELERRQQKYGSGLLGTDLEHKTIILVDDGMATGSTMRAAVRALNQAGAERIVVAVGTAPPDTFREIDSMVDESVCLITPTPFFGVGAWYKDFSQTTDEKVRDLLEWGDQIS